jgi:hypothetical protein
MFKRLDRSPLISRVIAYLSEVVAKRRGLPVVLGILIASLGFICQLGDHFSPSPILSLIGLIGQGLGTLIALIGLLLADALGK